MEAFERFYNIWPSGDLTETEFLFANAVNLKKLKDGTKITEEILFEKYTEYVESLKQFQNGKYTKKEFKIEAPADWLDREMYNLAVQKRIDPNDFYLYGKE